MNILMEIGIGVASPLLATLILYLFSRLNTTKRQLTFRLKSQNKLPNLDLGTESKQLELKWAGQTISGITVSQLNIFNSGKQEIKLDDLDGDINVTFPKENLLGISLINTIPPSFETKVKQSLLPSDDGFAIKPMLWNCKESIDITIITKQPFQKQDCKINARIAAGQFKLVDDRESENYTSNGAKILAITLSASIMAVLLFYFLTYLVK